MLFDNKKSLVVLTSSFKPQSHNVRLCLILASPDIFFPSFPASSSLDLRGPLVRRPLPSFHRSVERILKVELPTPSS